MKKIILTLAFALTTALTAQAQPVYSNVVGMVKFDVNGGEFTMLQFPFLSEDGSAKIVEEVFVDMPVGTKIYIWNEVGQTYDIVTKASPTLWLPQNKEIKRGVGFFVQTPAISPVTPLVMSGDVPEGNKLKTLKLGFNLVGFPFPAETTVENSALNSVTAVGDKVYLSKETGGYTIVTKASPTLWLPQNQIIPVGQSLFVEIRNSAVGINDTLEYTETAPY
jgi:hypothetical protein